jgi:hypothetical protein
LCGAQRKGQAEKRCGEDADGEADEKHGRYLSGKLSISR